MRFSLLILTCSLLAQVADSAQIVVTGQKGTIIDTPYDAAVWDGVADKAASLNVLRDKFESLVAGGGLGTADIDTSAELRTIVTDESGTGLLVFQAGDMGAGTATSPSAADNSTRIATTAWVQTELANYLPVGSLDDEINAGVPNGAGAQVHWSQLLGVPAGFADGTDDGGVGGDDNQTAAEVPFTPAGGIAATDTQAAIQELDTKKAPLASPTFSTALTLTGQSLSGASADSAMSLATTWNTTGNPSALKLTITDTASGSTAKAIEVLGGAAGTTSLFSVTKDGTLQLDGGTSTELKGNGVNAIAFRNGGQNRITLAFNRLSLGSGAGLSWASSSDSLSGALDTILLRDAANTVALRNGTSAQTFRPYGTYTDASNYRRLSLAGATDGSTVISSEGAGTGATGNSIQFWTDGVARMWITNANTVYFAGNLIGNLTFDDPDGNYTSTTVQGALAELDDDNTVGPNQSDYKLHWSQIGGVPAGFADGTDDGGAGTDDQTATEVPVTPAGTIAATDVQAALEELDGDITGHDHTGDTLNPDVLNVGTLNADALAITGLLPGWVLLDANTNLVNAAFTPQPADADLDDLASDGILTGSKVGTGINADNITAGTLAEARIHADLARDSEVAAGYQPLATMLTRLAAAPVPITFATTLVTDASLGCIFDATLTDNFTLANPTNPLDGQRIVWELIQDGTGSRLITLDTKFALGTDISVVTLTTTADKRDFLTAIYNATTDKWYVTGFSKGY